MRLNENAAEPQNADHLGTRERLLNAAIRLFGTRSFDDVTTREITLAAGVNIAAISYHFGSKEKLIAAAFSTIVRPINVERIRLLDEAAEEKRFGPLTLEDIITALVEPVVRDSSASTGGTYHRFHLLAYAFRRPFVDEIMRSEHDQIAKRFVKELKRSLPSTPEAQIWWRFDFAIGSLVHTMLDTDRGGRLMELSGGRCRTDDPDSILPELVSSIVGSFTGGAHRLD